MSVWIKSEISSCPSGHRHDSLSLSKKSRFKDTLYDGMGTEQNNTRLFNNNKKSLS